MFFYGLGDAGTGLAATQLGFFLLPFFIGPAQLSPLIAGFLLATIKLWDAFNDPLIGWLSDRTQTRWGPRIPWMICAAVPLGISLTAIWWVPEANTTIKTFYYVLIAIIFMSAYTSVNLPFSALSTEITKDTYIRTRLNAARFTGSVIAGLSGLVIAGLVLSEEAGAYFTMGKISGTLTIFLTLISCWGLAPFAKRANKPVRTKKAIKYQLKNILKNKKFIKVIILFFFLWSSIQLMQTVALIYATQVLLIPESLAVWIPIVFQLSALIGLQFWSLLSKKHDRIFALYCGCLIWIISCLSALFIPAFSNLNNNINIIFSNFNQGFHFGFLLLTILLIGFGAATAFLIPWSLLPDAIDSDPEKPAGLYTAWMVLIQKFGMGFSMIFFGFLLTISGYNYQNIEPCLNSVNCISQPLSAQIAIRICIGLIPCILILIGIFVIKDWDKDTMLSTRKEA
tara:strand:- start:499 stop:1860 length:1362 start_codon:yes stop_codon:yes gene_type:complete